jgi:DNA-directed RNA polymerase subunit K
MDKNMRYSRFERARIIGARALQITMGAPVLLDLPDDFIDPLYIATQEYNEDLIPITVKRELE